MRLVDLQGVQDPAAQRCLRRIEEWISQYEATSGINPLAAPSATKDAAVAPPSLAMFDIVGVNGIFTITITNPVDASGPIEHQLYTSSSVPLQASNTLTSLGRSTNTVWVLNAPDTTLFFGLKSRYLNSMFNALRASTAIEAGSTP